MEKSNIEIIRKIERLCVWATLFNTIGLFVCIYISAENVLQVALVFQIVVMYYIIIQINYACGFLKSNPIFTPDLAGYIRKVAYACFVSGIGSSVISTVVTSIVKKQASLTLDLTMIGIGCLLYVGAYIYQFGCEMKQELDLTI